jgi:hypothetical protein
LTLARAIGFTDYTNSVPEMQARAKVEAPMAI